MTHEFVGEISALGNILKYLSENDKDVAKLKTIALSTRLTRCHKPHTFSKNLWMMLSLL